MTAPGRRAYIDWARGLAVLLMIEAHATDAWTRPADKQSFGYAVATLLGGFAAPLFLWLAGVGLALAAARTFERTGSRAQAVEAVCRRGLEIFVLAFLFRFQAFLVSPPSTPLKLFRVDILNVMGPAMVLTGVLWTAAGSVRGRALMYAGVATAIAMGTPIVRSSAAIDLLPIWVQWYIRPAGEFTTFTLFPWAGFVVGGGAVGAMLADVRGDTAERRVHLALAAAGVLLVAGGFVAAARPSIYRSASFWTSSPTWFAIRIGILMMALALCFVVERVFVVSWLALARMGRASLFIYFIHVELVYGYASWLWRGRLPFWGVVIACLLFSVAMYEAIGIRDRVVAAAIRMRAGRSSWRPAPGR